MLDEIAFTNLLPQPTLHINKREVTGSNSVEALIFSGFFFPELLKLELKFTAMIILHFYLQPQFKYELFHKSFTSFHSSREDMNSIN